MHDWVHFHDKITNEVNSNQTYELMAYLPYSMVPWHTEFALHANATRQTDFPKQDYEVGLSSPTHPTTLQVGADAICDRSILAVSPAANDELGDCDFA
jgi:hypothetical protein